ncbi:MAG: hypothetical protein IBX64_12070 [Actinobacteria bacterium]|nr:hypothetical protein [Actinomycetota bacterium]
MITAYSPRRLANALQLDLLTQIRYYFLPIYMILALAYVAAIRLTPLSDYATLLLPLLLFSEPGLLGFYLAAGQLYFERNEKSLTALAVTPLRGEEYLMARAASNGIIATLAGIVLFILVFLVPVKTLLLIPPLFLTATLFALLGLSFSMHFDDFMAFVFASALVQIPLALPYLAYFGLVPVWVFAWVPSHPAIFSFSNLVSEQPSMLLYVLYLAELAVFNWLAFWWSRRVYKRRIRDRMEAM